LKSSVIPKRLRRAVLQRDDYTCQRCGRVIGNDTGDFFCEYSLQHRDPRGMGGSKLLHTLPNLVTLCGSATTPGMCHAHVESQRLESWIEGWLVPNGVTPEEWPVLRFGETYQAPGVEWLPAKPHARQVEMRAAA